MTVAEAYVAIPVPDLAVLGFTAASIGVAHTLLGPDHYLPFVALSRSRNWSTARTVAVTAACGLGHVLGSVAIGALGIAAGTALDLLVSVESMRGSIAAWLLLGLGIIYLAWGVRYARRASAHVHLHVHADGTLHSHAHNHRLAPHAHVQQARLAPGDAVTFEPLPVARDHPVAAATPWALFLIFVFGPCEPLIPVLMYPAAHASWAAIGIVCVVFAVATIGTMLAVVLAVRGGLEALGDRAHGLERWSHAIAGATLTACALLILLLGA